MALNAFIWPTWNWPEKDRKRVRNTVRRHLHGSGIIGCAWHVGRTVVLEDQAEGRKSYGRIADLGQNQSPGSGSGEILVNSAGAVTKLTG
jgi:hypothetical protein